MHQRQTKAGSPATRGKVAQASAKDMAVAQALAPGLRARRTRRSASPQARKPTTHRTTAKTRLLRRLVGAAARHAPKVLAQSSVLRSLVKRRNRGGNISRR